MSGLIAGCSGGFAVHDAYFHTRFRCPDPGIVWPDRFVILSAQATTGEHWSEAENEAADRQLELALGDWDCWYCRITGYSPDSGHAEPGWAADLSAEAGLELGRTFLQDAIYLVEDGELWVLDCDSPIVREYVGPFAERLDGD